MRTVVGGSRRLLGRRRSSLPWLLFSSSRSGDSSGDCRIRRRWFSTTDDDRGEEFVQSSKVEIFDRHLKRKQRDRAAWLMRPKDSFVDAVAENLLDRLEAQNLGKTIGSAREINGLYYLDGDVLRNKKTHGLSGGIEKLIMMDTSYDMIKLCKDAEQDVPDKNIETSFVVGDEEFLPVNESSLDLVISCLGLHWINDLPGAMIQCRQALKPDGLFLAAILGGETLKELRIACTIAQMEREGGISPRLSPLAQVRDAGNLLTRAGFTLPGVDVDEYIVKYKSGYLYDRVEGTPFTADG
ncbi:putative methyltransferase At1g22800, mitochondrial isoform X3 [Diospyros lotus]|uniref:putative methyltransferase At1g22800, mitochondrial isoform X3 n=1 Tax=Diospyros lotus TaxID=55363 RepID=UPI002251990E|nr:putative methyltransferase At1g22800, mitochondrial isoform X3 [Diospyros lotus]